MVKKKINTINLLIAGFFYMILGILSIIKLSAVATTIIFIIGIVILISTIVNILNNKKMTIKNGFNVIFSIILITSTNIVIYFLNILFGIYFLLITVIYIIEFLIYFKNKINGKIFQIFKIVIMIFLTSLIFIPNKEITGIIIGIYLVLLGIDNIVDFICEYNDKINYNYEITLPLLINMFIPKRLIKEIDNKINSGNISELEIEKSNIKPDLEVLIHLAKSGTASMGHVEISFENKTYSYGNYNMHSRKLFDLTGDGIIMVADKNKYIDYAINKKERYIISFGLILNDNEKELVKKRINELLKNTIEYFPDKALADQKKLENKNYTDMSSELYMYADAKFYKIIKGRRKRFFVLTTNCAYTAEYILSSTGNKIVSINGIITPGTYYDYLNNHFMMNNSNVISRKIYIKK